MNLRQIALHTIDVDRLDGGAVLDVGCRGFEFAQAVLQFGASLVHALDPAPDIKAPPTTEILFFRQALVGVGQAGPCTLTMGDNPEAWHLLADNTPGQPDDRTADVLAVDLPHLLKLLKPRDRWDAVKLNCEGAEYDILATWPGPIADQICVSFHEHTGADRGQDLDAILDHLGRWYDVVQHVRDERYCAGFNHWDTLLVRKVS